MIAAALLAMATSALSRSAPPTQVPTDVRCTASRTLLIGAWTQRSPPDPSDPIFPKGDSREFDFVVEDGQQVFREYLHFRPGGVGRWTLTNCRLTVIGRGWRTAYAILHLSSARLALHEVGGADTEWFTRIAE